MTVLVFQYDDGMEYLLQCPQQNALGPGARIIIRFRDSNYQPSSIQVPQAFKSHEAAAFRTDSHCISDWTSDCISDCISYCIPDSHTTDSKTFDLSLGRHLLLLNQCCPPPTPVEARGRRVSTATSRPYILDSHTQDSPLCYQT